MTEHIRIVFHQVFKIIFIHKEGKFVLQTAR